MKLKRKRRAGVPHRASRTTISIPKRIKDRMDEFQSRIFVNWSQVASDAFLRHMNASDRNKKGGK